MTFFGVVLAILAVTAAFALIAKRYGHETFAWSGAVALVGHIVVGYLSITVLPYGWDIAQFDRAAKAILTGGPTDASVTVSSFASFQSLLYATFGADPLVVSVVNGFLAVALALLVASLARVLYPRVQDSGGVTLLALFMPLPFLFLSVPMRDALAVFLFFAFLLSLALVFARDRYAFALPAIPLSGALYLLRPELALIGILGALTAAGTKLVDRVAERPPSVPMLGGIGAIAGVVGMLLFANRFPVSELNGALNTRATGGAAYLAEMRYAGFGDVVLAAPIRAIYFQFTPFPLQVSSTFDLLAALTLPLVVVLAIAGIRSALARETDTVVLVFLGTVYLAGIVGYGLIDANFGTTTRHRIPFVFLLIVFSAPVLQRLGRTFRAKTDVTPGTDW